MANEFKHKTVGSELTQAEWEAVGGHEFDSQATGDILYASSTTQLSRLAKGTDGYFLKIGATIPEWAAAVVGLLGVNFFDLEPCTGDMSNPAAINDGSTTSAVYFSAVNQYAQALFACPVKLTQHRQYGSTLNNGNGTYKIQYKNISDTWVDWDTGIPTRATADWSAWDSTGGEVTALGIKLIATALDTQNTRNYLAELEVKY